MRNCGAYSIDMFVNTYFPCEFMIYIIIIYTIYCIYCIHIYIYNLYIYTVCVCVRGMCRRHGSRLTDIFLAIEPKSMARRPGVSCKD